MQQYVRRVCFFDSSMLRYTFHYAFGLRLQSVFRPTSETGQSNELLV